MSDIRLYGFSVSPHVRTARLAFHEKSVPVDFREITLDDVKTEAYRAINPFGKMPALEHGSHRLYETPALIVYADAIGSGPGLQPSDPFERARMWQFIGIAQNYLHPIGAMQLYFHSVLAEVFGLEPDGAVAKDAVEPTGRHLDVLESALSHDHLAGASLSLADLYCGAAVDYVARTRDGDRLLQARPRVRSWLDRLRHRDSFGSTFPSMLTGTDQV